ncbi:Gem (nuclear organelle) associated protein 7 [Blomia tropicalis]|nr:Gem (nuclear organelle) associated protein 7 [Blomia tropicalis]
MDNLQSSDLKAIQDKNLEQRLNFLHFLACCRKQPASLSMYECSAKLDCQFEAFPHPLKHIAVSNLRTPIGMEKNVIIRYDDMICAQFHSKVKSDTD